MPQKGREEKAVIVIKKVFAILALLFCSAISALAQEGNGQLVLKMNEQTFIQTSVSDGHRAQTAPAIAGAVETHWLIADADLGPKAKAAGFDRVVVANFSGSFMFPGLRGNKVARRSTVAIARQYFRDSVEVVEENSTNITLAQAQEAPYPDDPLVNEQWHLGPFPGIGAMSYWSGTRSSLATVSPAFSASSVWVAVLDSGISMVPDLAANVIPEYSKYFGAGTGSALEDPSTTGMMSPYPDGHGTSVAGAIGEIGNNSEGGAGIDWDAKLVSYRIAYPIAGGLNLSITYEGVLKALVALLDLPVDHVVANCSCVWYPDSGTAALFENAVRALGDKGLLVVAAGNDGSTDQPYPSALNKKLDNVIVVGATDGNGQLAWFSNRGPGVDIAAPGIGILTPVNNGAYKSNMGTSLSAPLASGVASKVWEEAAPSMTSAQLKQVLLDGAAYNPLLEGLIAAPRQLSLPGSLAAMERLMATGSSKQTTSVTVDAITPVWTNQPGIAYGGAANFWGKGFTDGATFTVPTGSPLPTRLGGISVLIGTSQFPAFLSYVGPGQINAVFPMDRFQFPGVKNPISVIKYDDLGNIIGGATLVGGVKPVAFNPGIYTRDDGAIYAEVRGDRVVAYAVGLGFTNPPIHNGKVGTGAEQVTIPVKVFLDGQEVVDASAVASSVAAGLYEISWPKPSEEKTVVTFRVADGTNWYEQAFYLLPQPQPSGGGQSN